MRNKLALIGIASLASLTTAQTTIDGDAAGARLGEHFAVIPDVNGDSVNDLIAGFPDDDTNGVDAGRAIVISGADGTTLRTHYGDQAGDRFGEVVAPGGQLDGDSVGDYLVGAPEWGPSKGAVYTFSGTNGDMLLFMRGFNDGDRLGTSAARAGDVDGDGTGDVIVGAPGYDSPGSGFVDAGVIYAVSGATGLPLHTLESPAQFNRTGLEFGQFVSHLGDVNGDGHDDLLASGPNLDADTYVSNYAIFSGLDGSQLASRVGGSDGHGFYLHVGNGLCALGDVTGDGVPDYVAGESAWMSLFYDYTEGYVLVVHDGATNSFHNVYSFTSSSLNDDIVAGVVHYVDPIAVGDVNGDGLGDVAYLSPEQELVRVVSGADFNVLGIIHAPTTGLGFGTTIQGVDDVTGDGLRDLAIGIPGHDGAAGTDSGQIIFTSGITCVPPDWYYCTPEINSSGNRAYMNWSGTPSVSANDLILMATGCPPNKVGLFFYGPNQTDTPVGDGRLCVGSGGLGLFRVSPLALSNASGDASTPLDLTSLPASSGDGQILPGSTWHFQFWFRDPEGGPAGFNFSNGLAVDFCP